MHMDCLDQTLPLDQQSEGRGLGSGWGASESQGRDRQACAEACLTNVECNAFAWNRYNSGCYHKAGFDLRRVHWDARRGRSAARDFCFLAAPRTARDPQGYTYDALGSDPQRYNPNGTVLDKCYTSLTAVRLCNPGPDGWSGSVHFSADGGANYNPGICISCNRGAVTVASQYEAIGPFASGQIRADDTNQRQTYAHCTSKHNCTIVPFRRRIDRTWFRGLTKLQDITLSNSWLTSFAFMLGNHYARVMGRTSSQLPLAEALPQAILQAVWLTLVACSGAARAFQPPACDASEARRVCACGGGEPQGKAAAKLPSKESWLLLHI